MTTPSVREALAERLRESADEVMEFPHPSCCDHLHVAHELMREAAAALTAPDPVLPEVPVPDIGDYVLATKYSDGDPGDNWALGFFTHADPEDAPSRRFYVADAAGNNIRGNGFRRIGGPIRQDVGRWLLTVAADQLEASPPGVVNLWTMLTPVAFDLERDREIATPPPAAQASAETVRELSDEEIIAIRDAHLPNQGEGFDCIAFARALTAALAQKETR